MWTPNDIYIYEWDRTFSLTYPTGISGYGTTDYRHPAIELLQENGSRISEFQYESYEYDLTETETLRIAGTYTESEGKHRHCASS